MSAGDKTAKREPVSYYEILNVSPQDNDEAIRASFRRLALKHHPDRNPQGRKMAEHRFRLITEAYQAIQAEKKQHALKKAS